MGTTRELEADGAVSSGQADGQADERADEQADEQALAFEEKVARTNQLLLSNTLNRPILLRILGATASGALPLFDLESLIQSLPEFKSATQPPYFLIEWLVDAGALVFVEIDTTGAPITDEQREGKTEDEIDDLIDDIIIEITKVGKEVLAVFSPQQRLLALLEGNPTRTDTYLEVLEFLTEKHSYNEVDQLLRGRPVLRDGRNVGDSDMQPSVFVDKLASAGGIVFDEGWVVTPEGLSLLKSARSA
ncbi:MAG: hypothetical protein LBI64_02420 [Coriobacteriales bacterium]|jgi:hypothetical protein|nr:hypothetical protein [Coriobacteriales bacterium]